MNKHIHVFLSILTILTALTSNSIASWSVNGDAYVSGDRVILTDATQNEAGSAWIETKIDLSNNFDISFKINLGNNDNGADGISFALHNDPAGTSTFGDTSGGGEWVGMNGICPALGIEVDTYQNGSRGDLNADHLGINVYSSSGNTCSGVPDHNAAGPIRASISSTNIEDGLDHDLRITWDVSASILEVFFDNEPRLTYNNDIITNIFGGATDVYIGYTASTGGAYNQQSIMVNNANVDADKSVTPGSFLTSQNPKIATYTIDIMNNGTVTAFGTQITDTLPSGVTYVPGSTTGATTVEPVIDTTSVPGKHVLRWNLSALPVIPGGSRSISFNAVIPDTTGTFENDFTVSGDNFTQIDKTVRAAVLVGPSNLSVSTTHTEDFIEGTTGEYSVNVSNAGPDPGEGIVLTSVLPAGITYVSHTGSDWNVSSSSATDITFSYANSVASGGSATPLTITVNVGAVASSSITNSVSVVSSSPDPNISNNTATDNIMIKTTGIDLNIQMNHTSTFRAGNNGDYEIIVSNIGTENETGPVVVTASLSSDLSYVDSSGTGWTKSATATEWTYSGSVLSGESLPTISVTVMPNSSAVPSITNTASVVPSGVDSDNSNNSAEDITLVLDASTGNKPLYLQPEQKLSRAKPAISNSVSIDGNNQSETWIISEPLAEDLTLATGDHMVRLYIENNGSDGRWQRNRTMTVTLSSTDPTIGTIGSPVTITENIRRGTEYITEKLFNISIPSVTLPRGSAIEMTVNNNSNNNDRRSIAVHPIWSNEYSKADLNAITVIHIESLNAYDTAYTDGNSIPSSFLSGDTVFIRALISDPFGSYDITGAKVDIINPTGVTVISGESMTEVNDSGDAEKTYEYAFNTASHPIGVWVAEVTGFEGSERLVTHSDDVQFVVTQPMPDLTVVKTVLTYSDPVNNTTNPKAIPGAVVSYRIIVTNNGSGVVDNDSFLITDSLPVNTELYFDPSTGPIGFIDNGSSLSYNYVEPGSLTDDIEFFNGGGAYIPTPDASGYDDNITSFVINPKGTFNSYNGSGSAPSCSAVFMVRIK